MPFILLSSANRSTGTDSDFQIDLPFTISKYSKIRLKSAQLFNSFYNVTSQSSNGVPPNNRLDFQISANANGTPSTSYSVTIAQGYYTINTIMTALQTAINTAIAPMTCTVTLDALLKNIVITLSNPAMYINILPLKQNQGLNLMLGFSRTSSTGFSLGSVSAPRLPNLARYNVLYLETNLIRNSSISSGSGINPSNENQPQMFPVTATIQIDAGFGELVSFFDTTTVYLDLVPSISQIRCTLRDSFGYAVSTNGLQCLFEMEVY